MIYAYGILVKIKCLRNVCSKFNTGYFRGMRIARGEYRIKLVGLTLFYTLLYFVFSLFHGSEELFYNKNTMKITHHSASPSI